MKKFLVLLVVGVVSMAFSSCDPVDEYEVIGSWNIDKSTTKMMGSDDTVLTNLGTLNFNSDKTGSYNFYGGQSDTGSFTWSLSGNTLKLSDFNEYFDGSYKVLTSTSNELVIERSLLLVVLTLELSAL